MKTFVPRTAEELAATWPKDLDHISASSLGTLMRCPELWRLRYCLDQKAPPAGAAVWGRADHAAHAHNFAYKLNEHRDVPTTDVQDVFAEEFNRKVELEGGVSGLDWGKTVKTPNEKKRAAADYKDRGIKLVTVYHENISPSIQPVSVEEPFEVDVPDLPVQLFGRIDLRTADGNIVERKTTGRVNNEPAGDWALQGKVYQLIHPEPVVWHQSYKAKTMDKMYVKTDVGLPYVEEERARTRSLASQLVRLVGHYYQTYGPEHPWPGAITHPWACGYCAWGPKGKNSCVWWKPV